MSARHKLGIRGVGARFLIAMLGALFISTAVVAVGARTERAAAPQKVTGIGGVFFKAKGPKELKAWYQNNLGIELADWGGHVFTWKDADAGTPGGTVWGVFPADTKYFDPSTAPFMLNYRVRDLAAMLAQLKKAGAKVDEKTQQEFNGKFGWAMDPEGNRIELWEPAPGY